MVAEILYDPKKARARGVRVIDALTRYETVVTSRIVFCCASTIESVRLLMRKLEV